MSLSSPVRLPVLDFRALEDWRKVPFRVFSSSFRAASPMDLPRWTPVLCRLVQSNLLLFPMSREAERLACCESFVARLWSLVEVIDEEDRLSRWM